MERQNWNLLRALKQEDLLLDEQWTENKGLRLLKIWVERLIAALICGFLFLLFLALFREISAVETVRRIIAGYANPVLLILYHGICLYLCSSGRIFCQKERDALSKITVYILLNEMTVAQAGFSSTGKWLLLILIICWSSYYIGYWIYLESKKGRRLKTASTLLWIVSFVATCLAFWQWQNIL